MQIRFRPRKLTTESAELKAPITDWYNDAKSEYIQQEWPVCPKCHQTPVLVGWWRNTEGECGLMIKCKCGGLFMPSTVDKTATVWKDMCNRIKQTEKGFYEY